MLLFNVSRCSTHKIILTIIVKPFKPLLITAHSVTGMQNNLSVLIHGIYCTAVTGAFESTLKKTSLARSRLWYCTCQIVHVDRQEPIRVSSTVSWGTHISYLCSKRVFQTWDDRAVESLRLREAPPQHENNYTFSKTLCGHQLCTRKRTLYTHT